MNDKKPDFTGYATKANLKCSDGRTILPDAFAHQSGDVVPLVWSHDHNDPDNVLGHAILENVNDGVRVKAFFNKNQKGQNAKEMVRHGDVRWLSIYANRLVEKAKAVSHGMIREVSLVLAGANPGATIDQIAFTHSDGTVEVFDEEATITTGEEIEFLDHADTTDTTSTDSGSDSGSSDKTLDDIMATLNHEQRDAFNFLLSQALTVESAAQHSDTDADGAADANAADADSGADADADADADSADADADKDADADSGADAGTDADADADADKDADSTEDADKDADADADAEADGNSDADANADADADADSSTTDAGDDAAQHDNQEDNSMTHNLFDQGKNGANGGRDQVALSHDDLQQVIKATVKHGSMKEAFQHFMDDTGITVGGDLKHGIENIDYLFPDFKALQDSPQFLARRMEWVDKVLSSVRKTPFSRVKTITADITADEARARGYITGNFKEEEYFPLAKRETQPQTIYKKQKLDRDDVLDIVDLDVVAWMKAEMKVMLDEELAGAILIGDGRSSGDDDKIREDRIRPIASDAELYVTTVNVNLDDANSTIEELVDAAISHRKYYKGTGSPTFYTTEDTISAFLTVKDNFGQRIYKTIDDIKTVLRVSDVVPVEIMDRVPDVVGIMVNLTDYSLGADRGGQATMFDDFDIDYNKLIYLIETRCSGALTLPKSALVFRRVAASAARLANPQAPARAGNVVTVPTVSGVTYKDGDGNTLATGSPVTLAEGDTLTVVATANSGKYFDDNANDQWVYEYKA